MPCPRTYAELIDQTWSTAQQVHDVEAYLDTVFAERGDAWLEAPTQQHWVGAAADIQRLAKKTAASRRPRSRRCKPATTDRVQMELSF